MAVLKDPRFVKDPTRAGKVGLMWIPGPLRPMTRNMLDLDPPDHTRLRSLVQKAFTPRLVEQLRGRIAELCEGFLAPAIRQRPYRAGERICPSAAHGDHHRAARDSECRSPALSRLVIAHGVGVTA